MGARTFDAGIAAAFGGAVQAVRHELGISQEVLAAKAGIERSHLGKLERGVHLPTAVAIFKIADALGCHSYELMAYVEALLPASYLANLTRRTHG